MNNYAYWKANFSDPAAKLLLKLFVSFVIALFITAPFIVDENRFVFVSATLLFLIFPIKYTSQLIALMVKEFKYYRKVNK
jgi:uncharacterized membrane protein